MMLYETSVLLGSTISGASICFYEWCGSWTWHLPLRARENDFDALSSCGTPPWPEVLIAAWLADVRCWGPQFEASETKPEESNVVFLHPSIIQVALEAYVELRRSALHNTRPHWFN